MKRAKVGLAAKENGISRRTLQRWVRDGVIDRGPDGTVDVMEVAFRVGRRQSSDRRPGPAPGQNQAQLRLGKTRTGRRLSDFQRLDIIVRHLNAIDDPVVLGFAADQVHNVFAQRMGALKEGLVRVGESMARYIKDNPAPTSTSSPRSSSSAVAPAVVPAQ
jgi:hypothetical protein